MSPGRSVSTGTSSTAPSRRRCATRGARSSSFVSSRRARPARVLLERVSAGEHHRDNRPARYSPVASADAIATSAIASTPTSRRQQRRARPTTSAARASGLSSPPRRRPPHRRSRAEPERRRPGRPPARRARAAPDHSALPAASLALSSRARRRQSQLLGRVQHERAAHARPSRPVHHQRLLQLGAQATLRPPPSVVPRRRRAIRGIPSRLAVHYAIGGAQPRIALGSAPCMRDSSPARSGRRRSPSSSSPWASSGSLRGPPASPPGATSGNCWAPSRSCSSRSASCSSACCRGSRSGSTGSTARRSGIAVSRSPVWSCWLPHVLLSSNPDGTALGGPLGAIGAIGLVGACAVGDPAALAVGRAGAAARARARRPRRARSCATFAGSSAATSAGGRCTAPPGCSSPPASPTACSTGRRSTTRRSCAGATSRSAPSAWGSTSTASCSRASSSRCTTTRSTRSARSTTGLVEVALRPLGRRRGFRARPVRDGLPRGQGRLAPASVHDRRAPRTRSRPRHGQGARRLHLAPAGTDRAGHAGGDRRAARRFSHWRGTDRQVWIAGGRRRRAVPQLAARARRCTCRIASTSSTPPTGEAPFADEIRAIADRHESLRAHLIDTSIEVASRPSASSPSPTATASGLSVFMCGPRAMLRTFQTQLRRAGVPARRIHREHFDWR